MKRYFIAVPFLLVTTAGGLTYNQYRTQEKSIFRSIPLDKHYTYTWDTTFQEVFLPSQIHALWFKTPNPKGVVLFFHGRGKNLTVHGTRAFPFLHRGYDVFAIDYHGFGKSAGELRQEEAFLDNGCIAYQFLQTHYKESDITIVGHSLGTSIATYVAHKNNPRTLILEAPFYNMIEAASYTKKYLPEWVIRCILKYPLRTDQWITKVTCPITLFHGTADTTVPFEHSQKLFEQIKHKQENDLVLLPNVGHSLHEDPTYQEKLSSLL